MILGATECLDALSVSGTCRINVFSDRRRADKTYSLHAGVLEQRVDSFLVTVDDVIDAVRQAGFLE